MKDLKMIARFTTLRKISQFIQINNNSQKYKIEITIVTRWEKKYYYLAKEN